MTTREEKFEAERQKMLSQMGIENKEIEVEPEEVEVEKEYYQDPSREGYVVEDGYEVDPNWSEEVKENYKEYANKVTEKLTEDCDLILNDFPEHKRREKEKSLSKQRKIDKFDRWESFVANFCLFCIFAFSFISALVCYGTIDASRPLATKIISPLVVFIFAAFCSGSVVFGILAIREGQRKNI